ncbi:MAG: histidinol-phosphate transaminase, partial [Dokdonella sp.]
HRYPDPSGTALKEALSAHTGVAAEGIVLGNGSHELLMLLAQCFAGPKTAVAYSQYGFAVFAIAAAAVGAETICVPALGPMHTSAPYGHDLPALAAAVTDSTRLLYLANPNNPTGTWFEQAALEECLQRVPRSCLVVLDEAYHEYAESGVAAPAAALLAQYPNLVITRTFSKAYALAGLRVGYALAHPSVVAVLERMRESFNVNSLGLAAAEAALMDQDHLQGVRRFTHAEREWLHEQLAARGFRALPSQTNFLLIEAGPDAAVLEQQLFARGVIVRPMAGYRLGHMLRISVGAREENQRLLEALPHD